MLRTERVAIEAHTERRTLENTMRPAFRQTRAASPRQLPPDHWVRRPCGHGRWRRSLSDVQPRHSRPTLHAKYLSSDNDPLYRFHQWQANLRILEVTEIKSLPYVPLSHPFVERLIGTLRREYLDHFLFWTTVDLENKRLDFRSYFNHHRTHTSREGRTPDPPASRPAANLRSFRWQPHCRALYQTPVAA